MPAPGAPLLPRRRPLAAAVAALVLATGPVLLAGCTFTNPQTTTVSYVPGDGQDLSVGDVVISSLMVVTADEGQPGRLVARVVNAATEPRQVTITGEGLDEVVTAPPQDTLAIGDPDDPEALDILIDAVSAAPGRLVPITLTVDRPEGPETAEIGVPVLDGTLEQYAPYLPTPTPVETTSPSGPTPGGGGNQTEAPDPDSTGPVADPEPTPGAGGTATSGTSDG